MCFSRHGRNRKSDDNSSTVRVHSSPVAELEEDLFFLRCGCVSPIHSRDCGRSKIVAQQPKNASNNTSTTIEQYPNQLNTHHEFTISVHHNYLHIPKQQDLDGCSLTYHITRNPIPRFGLLHEPERRIALIYINSYKHHSAHTTKCGKHLHLKTSRFTLILHA